MATQSNPKYTLSGRITDLQGGPLEGLMVRAFDQDPRSSDDQLGQAVTSEEGKYSIRFTQKDFKIDGVESGGPDVYIQVYAGEELLEKSAVRRNAKNRIIINLQVDHIVEDAAPEKAFTVRGMVRHSDGRPLLDVIIRAHDQGLRKRSNLGEAKTDASGRYEIGYDKESLLDLERGSANLVVEVIGAGGATLTTSEVRFNARIQETVNLTADTDANESEWERLEARLAPALQGASLTTLSDEELSFLEKSARVQTEQLKLRRQAATVASQSELPEWFHFALLRQGLPGELDGLLGTPELRIRKALSEAQQAGIVAASSEMETAAFWKRLDTLHTERALDKPIIGRRLKVRQVLEVAGLEQEPRQILARALAKKDLQRPDTWAALQAETGLEAPILDRVQFTLRAAELADDHLATIAALHQDERVHSLRDLAKHYDPATWHELVEKAAAQDGSDLPEDLPGHTAAERRAQFARRLFDRVAEQHPDVAVIYGLARHPRLAERPATRLLPQLLETNASFDLARVRVDAYVREHGEELGIRKGDSAEEAAVRDDLKRVQRVYRLRAEPRAVARLLEDGLDSSFAILSQGRERFLEIYGTDEASGPDVAKQIYARAETNAARALAVYARFSPTINTGPKPAAVSDCPAELIGVPNFTTLFGSLDGCACEPCESVYSPAAYLTDLLAFLEHEVQASRESGFSSGLEGLTVRSFCDRDSHLVELQPRRPDILDTKLSCRNAETLIPYVDLVLEVLENAVAPRDNGVPQTTLTAEQLAAQPEHVIPAAYDKLADAIFPFDLPFDLRHEEATLYLEQLGTSRAELLEALFPFVDGDDAHELTEIRRLEDTTIAAARLGLTEVEWKLIADLPLTPAVTSSSYWGYAAGADNWWHPLHVVDAFLQRSGLDYNDLLRLLTLKSFNPHGRLSLKFAELSDCDPKRIQIEGLDDTALSFLHRFLRLQRAMGWSLQVTDQVLRGLALRYQHGRPELNELLLVRVSNFLRLASKFKLPLAELLSLLGLDTADYRVPQLPHETVMPSLYESLFLVGRPGEAQYDAFELNASRTELKDVTQPLVENPDPIRFAVIAGALRLSVPDLKELADELLGRGAKLTLASLSELFVYASLARALGLTVPDFLTLGRLFGDGRSTATTGVDGMVQFLRFIERIEAVRSAGFSIAELDYILRQTTPYESGKTLAPTDEWVASSLATLRAALERVSPFNAPRVTVGQALELLGPGPDSAATTATLRPLIEQALEQIGAAGEVGTDRSLVTVLREALAVLDASMDHAALHSKLLSARTILDGVLNQALATALSELLGVSPAVAVALLGHVLSHVGAGVSAGEAFLRAFAPIDSGVAAPPTDAELGLLLYRLHKSSLVVLKLGITHQELPRFITISKAVGWLNLASLPVRGSAQTAVPPQAAGPDDPTAIPQQAAGLADPTAIPQQAADPAASVDAWARTVQLFHLRDHLPEDQQEHLFSLFEIAERQMYTAKLAELSGWSKDDIGALVGTNDSGDNSAGGGILQARFPQQFADERLPRRIMTAVMLVRRLGVTALDVNGWIARQSNPVERDTQVEQIKQALKARHGDSWPAVLKPLRDPLREQQRQALVTYLLHAWNLFEPADLYDHFLIDVEMSPCMMTSRLIQATAAVQLFVQRILMNLEPGLALSEEGAEQWEWMKNYRVWEANRKIFLYPENWIEPELRDDKTPFFKELENELRQADINNETAENALLHYLQKLHEVARLQVCGQYLEKGNPTTVHVFARTRDMPHRYYYRRGLLEIDIDDLRSSAFDASWTPWERVDVDIEGDHLIPVVYNRRVYLFWPVFTSEDEAPLTQTLQTLLSYYAELFKLVTTFGTLVQSLFQGLGVVTIGGITNSIIQIVAAIEDAINIDPLELIDLDDMKEAIRKTRKALLKTVGVSSKGNDKHDDTQKLLDYAKLTTFDDLSRTFDGFLAVVKGFEDNLLSILPAKRLEVQLAWSEFRQDSWSAKKTSANVVTFRDVVSTLFETLPALPGLARKGVRRLFTFRTEVKANNQLIVYCDVALPTSLLDAATNTNGLWLSEPTEIGHFRLNTCSGQLDADDKVEEFGLSELLTQVTSELFTVADAALDRQLQQRGEPITPDDDPNRPSRLRDDIETGVWPRLPHHFIAGQGEDVYRLLTRHQASNDFFKLFGFFYQDSSRTFFCSPWSLPKNNPGKPSGDFGYIFFPFYHPYSCDLLANLQRFGVPGIYDVRFSLSDGSVEPAANGQPLQITLKDDDLFSAPEYDPIDNVYNPPDGPRALRPIEEISFSTIGAYAQYNWELFLHVPLLIATQLSTNQKFHEAQQWFHYIFNPTDASRRSAPEKYWRTRPFVEASAQDYEQQQIDELLQMLSAEAESPGLQELEWAVRKWRNDAFNPHLVARARTVAFQKAVVMKYVDNLIAWGDHLFRQETREAIGEATQLYILAAKLLGPRPRRIPREYARTEYSYAELTQERPRDAFSNALVEIESLLPVASGGPYTGSRTYQAADRGRRDRASLAPVGNAWRALVKSRSLMAAIERKGYGSTQRDEALYFCVPPNDKLIEKWDIAADRLFKIRHCKNIGGQALNLPLLAPFIDPAILVRARAMGVNIDSVLSQLHTPVPNYRFQVLAQKATELCGEVKSLGAALLGAVEKRDGEALALLRSTQEARLLEAVQAIKEQQIGEAKLGLEGLKRSQHAITLRRDHHQRLVEDFMNPEERASIVLGAASLLLQFAQVGAKAGAATGSLVPNIKAGFVTTLGTMFGGQQIGDAAGRGADVLGHIASILSSTGGLVSTMGGYRRREEDWQLQIALANKELEGMEKQLAAAEIRVAIAEADLDNHKLQIRNNRETHTFMQQKFTNQELYDWMVAQTTMLYFQSYQLAYDLARKCERAFSHELGVDTSGIIHYAYWDSLKKGLLAGEYLHHDLKRLEVAYLDQNNRELELTKHISLAQLDPMQLIRLKETGKCEFELPAWLFDLDFPGHYFRRIKSVSITIPCVVAPYASVNATLTLRDNMARTSAGTEYKAAFGSNQQIATSSAQQDSGLFELNFRDERYMPFEYAGAISTWTLELSGRWLDEGNTLIDLSQFDFETISDVVLHLRYTARQGSDELKQQALAALKAVLANAAANPQHRLFSLRHEFPAEWHRLRTAGDHSAVLALHQGRFPLLAQRGKARINGVDYIIVLKEPRPADALELTVKAPGPGAVAPLKFPPEATCYRSQNQANLAIDVSAHPEDAGWQLTIVAPTTRDEFANIEDIMLVAHYTQ